MSSVSARGYGRTSPAADDLRERPKRDQHWRIGRGSGRPRPHRLTSPGQWRAAAVLRVAAGFFAAAGGEVVGFCRSDRSDRTALISLALSLRACSSDFSAFFARSLPPSLTSSRSEASAFCAASIELSSRSTAAAPPSL